MDKLRNTYKITLVSGILILLFPLFCSGQGLVISSGASLVNTGNIIITGNWINNGIFSDDTGTVFFSGTGVSIDGTSSTSFFNITVLSGSTATAVNSGNSVKSILLSDGTLNAGGNLTLISSASGTALIDGSGAGQVSGNVIMQRYLSSGFGYKYFSSPFQAATVNEFGDDMNLGSAFTSFYRYDESRIASGWVNYKTTTNILNPFEGYAVNFGSVSAPNTVDVTGVVNNGSVSVTLYNHNNVYTKGFNLVGNPFPSPIDWDAASGWTKTNIDSALYYFKASATDQYGGTYSSYVNGISSDGLATAIIPSMQGVFIHVSDGAWPVTGSLVATNSVRVTDKTHAFLKSGGKGMEPIIRLIAGFSDDTSVYDPVLINIDETSTAKFDNQFDALKLYNTDRKVPNLYTVAQDGSKLSIDSRPMNGDSLGTIPLGIRIEKEGDIIFRIKDIGGIFAGKTINIFDAFTGRNQDILPGNQYLIHLTTGEYRNRFYLNSQNIITGIPSMIPDSDLFSIYSNGGILKADINILPGMTGTMYIYNLTGQLLFVRKIYESGYYEFSPGINDGIYIATFISGIAKTSKKIIVQNR